MKQLLITSIVWIYTLFGFSQITEVEYFIDNDPGAGNAISLSVTAGNTIDEIFTIPTTGLTNGMHILQIRAKGTNAIWSLYYRDYFYIHTITNETSTAIVAAEYFFDTDPGVGSGTALPITSGFNISETFAIDVPMDMLNGNHYLYIRVQDQDSNWSLYYRDLFEVDSSLSVETFTHKSLDIFPNPTNDALNVNFKELSNYKLSLFDINGKLLFNKKVTSLLNTLNFNEYEKGLYILKIKEKGSSKLRAVKIIKN